MEKTDKNIKNERMSQKAYIVFFLIYYPLSWGLFLLSMAIQGILSHQSSSNVGFIIISTVCYLNWWVRIKFARKRLIDLGKNPKSKLLLLHSNAITEIILHIYLMVKKSVPTKDSE